VKGVIDVEDPFALYDFIADSEKGLLPLRFRFKILGEKGYDLVIVGCVRCKIDEILQQLGGAVDQVIHRLVDSYFHLPVYEMLEEALLDDGDEALGKQADQEK